ncbi:hypothetical protein DFH11DRAFT_1631562 [Phellopilus nigrolimitatus]|nr:hypothetical protein DFH11DRAFT_1631562 [Phellopilus nigrolimitatus]
MSWEDIIILKERMHFEKEDSRERKRTHAPVSYEGIDVDQPAPAPSKKPKTAGPVRKMAGQKALELKGRDIRVLVREESEGREYAHPEMTLPPLEVFAGLPLSLENRVNAAADGGQRVFEDSDLSGLLHSRLIRDKIFIVLLQKVK